MTLLNNPPSTDTTGRQPVDESAISADDIARRFTESSHHVGPRTVDDQTFPDEGGHGRIYRPRTPGRASSSNLFHDEMLTNKTLAFAPPVALAWLYEQVQLAEHNLPVL